MGIETTVLETTGKGVWGIWTKIIKPYLTKRKEERRKLLSMIQEIHGEVKFNGGGTIKDAIWDLKKGMAKIDTRISEIQESHHLALNLQGIAFWISNDHGECVYVSTNLCKITGRTESDLMGNNWIAWVIPDDRDRIFEAWQFSVENKSPFDEVYTFRRSDGSLQKVWGLAFHKKILEVHHGSMGKIEAIGEPFKK